MNESDQTRRRDLMFWWGCIPTRLALAYYASMTEDAEMLRIGAAAVGATWALGFMDDRETGFAGGDVWWADDRPIHGALWLAYAATGHEAALLADVAYAVVRKLGEESRR